MQINMFRQLFSFRILFENGRVTIQKPNVFMWFGVHEKRVKYWKYIIIW